MIGLTVAGALLIVVIAVGVAGRGDPLRAPAAGNMASPPPGDPFSYRSAASARFTARALAGEAHVLFSASPGGATATAARVDRLRGSIDTATKGSGIDPNLLEGLVFVESAGRTDAIAGNDPANAAGLAQIMPSTATTMLGLRVDVARSRRLTAAIARAQDHGAGATAIARLARQRAAADQRFTPAIALRAAVHYLVTARARLIREDLAFVSYHMGIGNLQGVLDAYDGGAPVPYVQLYFDTTPDRHAAAYARLSAFADQSSLYWWRVLGAVEVMRLYRSDRAALQRMAALQTDADSAAALLHPPDQTPAFGDPAALSAAYGDGTLRRLPANGSQLGLAFNPSIGAQARSLHAPAALYGGLRPVALALLIELAARVRELSLAQAPLTVTSAVADSRYQKLLGIDDPPAAAGYAFTIARRYATRAQAGALQAMLERLQALDLIAWTRYPSEIEVTVASDAARVIADGP